MDNYTLALVIMGAISFILMIYGLVRRSKGLAFIGFVFTLVCALCYVIVYFYGDALYITGQTYKL